jgi:hypothetical protein
METNDKQYTGLKGVNYKDVKLNPDKIHQFDIPNFEEIFPPTAPCHPFYTYHDKPFNKERYMYGNPPIHIGLFNLRFNKDNIINVLRCPIKVTGNRTILLPDELFFLKDYVEYCCIYETSFNKNFEKLYGHITADYKEFKVGETHRVPGWHVDGFQGSKFPIKHEIEHSYLITTDLGTEFCPKPFFIDKIDDSKYLIFDELNKQAIEENIIKCMPNNIYLFDPYMVHRSPVAKKDTNRLLVRITFEYNKLLDPNDTQNPKIPCKVPYKYDVRNRLGTWPFPLNLQEYGYEQ